MLQTRSISVLFSNSIVSEATVRDSARNNEEIKQLLETIRPDTEISKENREGTPDALKYPLLEHQKLGVSWMKAMEESEKKGGILADDMGLGKTIQALALMVSRPSTDPQRKPTLIVAPVSLMQQWKREIHTMVKPACRLSVYILHGERRRLNFTDLMSHDVVLTTFGTLAAEYKRKVAYEEDDANARLAHDVVFLQNELPVLGPNSGWHRVIIDEAQCIKNRNSKAAQACCLVKATYRWCMSGTPMMNSVQELHSLIKFLRIRPYCELERFTSVRDQGYTHWPKLTFDLGFYTPLEEFGYPRTRQSDEAASGFAQGYPFAKDKDLNHRWQSDLAAARAGYRAGPRCFR